MERLLKVASVERKTDSSDQGVKYDSVSFVPQKFTSTGREIFSHQKARVRNFFDKRNLPDGSVIAADPLFGKLTEGALVEGEIKSFKTTLYTVEGGTPTEKITCVIFDDEGDGVMVAARQLRDYGAAIITEGGDFIRSEKKGSVQPKEGNAPKENGAAATGNTTIDDEFTAMNKAALKAYIAENELEIEVSATDGADAIRGKIREALA